MKTSNKLLIVLATLLIIVPILTIAINFKMNYAYVVREDYISRQQINNEPFNKKSAQRVAIPIQMPFNFINVADAKGIEMEIHLNNSEVFGIKVPNFAKDYFKFEVDGNGFLNITINGNPDLSNAIPISIYAPKFKGVNVSNSRMLVVSAIADSLEANLSHVESFSLSGAITTNDQNGKVIQSFNGTNVGKLTVNLVNSIFSSEGRSYENLIINTKGRSEIGLTGDENAKDRYRVNNLTINTIDTASVTIGNIKINKLSGKISDQTTILAPVLNLKQLFKN
ncbi:hypothetical protein DHW03_09145 [Pedobacter yonginense]|uniref:Uncharacterized protein n=1 Tax=Pedobacter yonginense TaxID=651869 RepID=A0A317EMA6_9SPHI|nr:hypothetical protein [Pedobacter yonginense]PWS27734.1 hypothetical protein DHW03_09145 [Pedobacter yonginense]